jgi:hypothetical protein
MYSSAAISLFVRPWAASSATSRSVSVSSSEAGARPLIRRSSALAFSAHSGASSSSKIASTCPSASRAARFCFACLRGAEAEQRASALEDPRRRRLLGDGQSATAARRRPARSRRSRLSRSPRRLRPGHSSGTPPPSPMDSQSPYAHLVRLEVGTRSLQLTERDQRLDRVRPERLGRLGHASGEQLTGKLTQVIPGASKLPRASSRCPRDAARPPLDCARQGPRRRRSGSGRRRSGLRRGRHRVRRGASGFARARTAGSRRSTPAGDPARFLDLDASLEQAGSDLRGVLLAVRQSRDYSRDERGISHAVSLLERGRGPAWGLVQPQGDSPTIEVERFV